MKRFDVMLDVEKTLMRCDWDMALDRLKVKAHVPLT